MESEGGEEGHLWEAESACPGEELDVGTGGEGRKLDSQVSTGAAGDWGGVGVGCGWGWGRLAPGRGSRRAQVVAVQGNVGELIGEVGLERGPAVTATTTQLQDES